ncbi:peptidase inhibitor family I36 protein [Saccharothrix australiensis]|uniref:Peptidase inhibitor family I36 n=1 Tax=Saccharothrix australiensis TaxID=2072 RepID=A0A495W075_9PSEU|nr:peptidase inhibitor family I36 [Saccharothrix australiensis]
MSSPANAAPAPLPARGDCAAGRFCLFDGANGSGLFYSATDGCRFLNIGLEGAGDRADSAYNRTSHPVDIADWTGSAWEHLATVHPGQTPNPDGNSDKADAIHSICRGADRGAAPGAPAPRP